MFAPKSLYVKLWELPLYTKGLGNFPAFFRCVFKRQLLTKKLYSGRSWSTSGHRIRTELAWRHWLPTSACSGWVAHLDGIFRGYLSGKPPKMAACTTTAWVKNPMDIREIYLYKQRSTHRCKCKIGMVKKQGSPTLSYLWFEDMTNACVFPFKMIEWNLYCPGWQLEGTISPPP